MTLTTRSPNPGLLRSRFAPITHAVGFLEAPMAVVIDADHEWRTGIGMYQSQPLIGSLESHLSALLPLTAPSTRYIWVDTRGSWTAYFDNSINGSDPWSPMPYLSRRLGCRGVAILWAPQTRSSYGGARFDIYGQPPTDELNYTRTVSVINDGGSWQWCATGQIQPFEITEAYAAKRVRDRLTSEIMDHYARALGISAYDAGFYGEHALLVTNSNLRCELRQQTLYEAQKVMGLESPE